MDLDTATAMKAVVQRVTSASVTVDGSLVSTIGKGLCVLIGIHRDDTREQAETLARKLINLRVFDDPATGKRWSKSVKDLDLELLCVSQFTLYHVMKGNKPDFHLSMGGDASRNLHSDFIDILRKGFKPDRVHDGVFGAMMQVDIANDGPVTLELDIRPTSSVSQTSNESDKNCVTDVSS